MLVIDTGVCDRCGTCIAVCPRDALVLVHELTVDRQTCTCCGACVKICPFAALRIDACRRCEGEV